MSNRKKENTVNKRHKGRISLLLLLLLLLLCIFTGFYYVTRTISDSIVRLSQANLEEVAIHDRNAINQRMNMYWNDIAAVADDVRMWHNYDGSDVLKLLSGNSYLIPNIHRLALLADDGTYYKSTGVIEYHPDFVGWCRKHPGRQLARGSEFDIFTYTDEMKDVIVFVCPIDSFQADGHTFTHAFCSVLISGLESEFMIPSYNDEGWSCLVDAAGDFIIHINRGHTLLEDLNVFDLIQYRETSALDNATALREKLINGSEFFEADVIVDRNRLGDSERSYVLFLPVPDSDWILVSVTPTRVFTMQTVKIMAIVLILLMVMVLSFALVIFLVIKQRRKQQSLASQMFERFSENFTSVYLVDAGDNSYQVLKRTQYLNNTYPQALNFIASIDAYIEMDVYPEDRVLLTTSTRHEYILERLRDEEKFTIRYRDISARNREPRWYEMTAARVDVGNSEAYLLGFADRHGQVLEEFIRDKMYSKYISVFYVDLENDTFRVLRDKSTSDITRLSYRHWSQAVGAIAETCPDEETKASILSSLGDVHQLQMDLTDEPEREYLHRWGTTDKPWRRVNAHAFETNRGIVTSAVLGVSFLDDYTAERQELTSELEAALERAEEASKAKTVFLNSMSHDIRTPMNAILGFTEIARRHIGEDDKVADSLEKVKSAGEHLLSLINDVLDMSRIDSGTITITPVKEDLRTIQQNIGPIFETLSKEKNISFSLNVDDVEDYAVKADRLRMNQILINVVSNAIKYTDDGGKVSLTVRQMGDVSAKAAGAEETSVAYAAEARVAEYAFIVKDNGIGMSPEFQEHLFETFSREETASVSKREGTGLGLSITKRLVDMMGGSIKVDSAKGVGSTFTITIPFEIAGDADGAFKAGDAHDKAAGSQEAGEVAFKTDGAHDKAVGSQEADAANKADAADKAETAFKAGGAGQKTTLEGKRVLLVDDNDFNREIGYENLSDEGMVVEEAVNGSDALKKVTLAGPNYFDVVLMDVQMPVMNGYEATEAIRKLGKEYEKLPIIAVSANAFEEDIQKSMESGMSAHLSKPIRIPELLSTLEKLL